MKLSAVYVPFEGQAIVVKTKTNVATYIHKGMANGLQVRLLMECYSIHIKWFTPSRLTRAAKQSRTFDTTMCYIHE